MIITINGANGKKNKSVCLTASYAAMLAISTRQKTLVLQYINNDIDCVEYMYQPFRESNGIFGDISKADISEAGMDALMARSEVTKLTKQNFDELCKAMVRGENNLDVATVSASATFVDSAATQTETIGSIVENAKDVYDNIIILAPPYKEEKEAAFGLSKFLNKLADVSIYCIRQGHKPRKNFQFFGKKIHLVVTEFEHDSVFTVASIKKIYASVNKKLLPGASYPVYKLARCTALNDSIFLGSMLKFILENLSADSTSINFAWVQDLKQIIEKTTGDKFADPDKEKFDPNDMEPVLIKTKEKEGYAQ